MSESRLDQIVKGAPPPTVTAPQVAQAARAQGDVAAPRPADPTSLLPSSPPQIYLNLLILEASLRSQYLTLRARRRQNAFVLTLLVAWIAYFDYALFLRPREDGHGVGGSVYWVVDMGEKLALISGVVMGILFWGTGQWERGVRWPRRWVGVANRGLRSMNCKIVVIKGPWWKELLSHLSFLIPYQLFFPNPGSSYHYVEYPVHEKRSHLRSKTGLQEREMLEEDVAPGGDYIKLLLLPKPFSADFRQNWEIYRTEYWEKENERRAELRKRIKQMQREIAKQEAVGYGGPAGAGWERARGLGRGADVEKSHQHSHSHTSSQQGSLREKKRRPSVIKESDMVDQSHSRSSSRSTTPTAEMEDTLKPGSFQERRWSNSTTGSNTDRRRKKAATGLAKPSRLTPSNSLSSRPKTPTTDPNPMPAFAKRTSNFSTTSTDSDRSATLTPDERGTPSTTPFV